MRRFGVMVLLVFTSLARGELRSDELLLIYNRNSPASRELAEYYGQRRAVPEANRIGLDLPLDENLSRREYDSNVVAPIRQYLWDNKLADKVRCLVTFYDVPLRVGPRELTPVETERAAWVDRKWDEFGANIEKHINIAHVLAEGATGPRAEQIAAMSRRDQGVSQMRKSYVNYRRRISSRLGRVSDADEAAQARIRFLEVAQALDGLAGADRAVSLDPNLYDEQVAARLKEMKRIPVPTDQEIEKLLSGGLLSPDYPKGIELLAKRNGLTSAYRRLADDRKQLNTQDTQAAVDNELALLWWRPYRLSLMIYNWLNVYARKNAVDQDGAQRRFYSEPVLMTARLDGPSPAVVRRMIDDAIATEATGLKGKFYIDRDPARREKEFAWMDQAMNEAASLLRAHAPDVLPVVVDESKEVFQPGACLDTALYVGWYSLMNYVDAFQFVPGAVGYHVASGEAVSLRDSSKGYWCKEMLARGATATLGAVSEPYLQAMVPPDRFFGLLLTGQFTLAETFTLSNRYLSWMIILIGDPLYTPFKADPVLTLDKVLKPDLLPVDQGFGNFSPMPSGPQDVASVQ